MTVDDAPTDPDPGPDAEDVDRGRGILSPTDREFLLADEEEKRERWTRQARNQRWQKIRERVHNAVLDATLLFEYWPDEERERTFYDPAEGRGTAFEEGIADLLGLLYRGTVAAGRFQELLSRGVGRAERQRPETGNLANVRVGFNVQRVPRADLDQAIKQFAAGRLDRLTEGERIALLYLLRNVRDWPDNELEALRDELLARAEAMAEEAEEERRGPPPRPDRRRNQDRD